MKNKCNNTLNSDKCCTYDFFSILFYKPTRIQPIMAIKLDVIKIIIPEISVFSI